MASVNFFLKKEQPDENGLITVFMNFAFSSKRIKLSVKEKVHPKYWDERKKRVKPNAPGAEEINHILDMYSEGIQKAYRELRLANLDITAERLKSKFGELTGLKVRQAGEGSDRSVAELFEMYIESHRSFKSPGTLRLYPNVKRRLEEFSPALKASQMKLKFFSDFSEWLINEKDVHNNTVWNYAKIIRNVFRFADKNNIKVPKDYLDFSVKYIAPVHIYHTEEELMKLYGHQSKNKTVGMALNIYLLAAFTFLRYQDVVSLRPDLLVDADYIDVIIKKTRKINRIPISDYAREILKRLQGQDIKISNQKLNKYIKKAVREAGIDTPVVITTFKNGVARDIVKPKWQLVSIHKARHTIATLSLIKGMDLKTVQELLGHSSPAVTAVYLHLAEEEKKKSVDKIWSLE